MLHNVAVICKIKSGDLVLKEHEAAKWLTKEKSGQRRLVAGRFVIDREDKE